MNGVTTDNKAVGYGLVLSWPFKIQSDEVYWIIEGEESGRLRHELASFRRARRNLFVGWPKLAGPSGKLP